MIKSILYLIISLSLLASGHATADSPQTADTDKERSISLWSDKEDCMEEGALIIAIETYGESYSVTACVKYGCRIAVPEFGKRDQQLNFTQDPKFKWQSEAVFDAVMYGKNTRFYACDIEIK